MKWKMAIVAALVATAVSAMAGEQGARRRPSPIGFALFEPAQFPTPENDVLGLRICLIYGRNANVMGIDTGVFGCGVDGNMFGLQVSGFLNDVGSSWGAVQLSGIANICAEDFYGLQLSGIANSTSLDFCGQQLSIFNNAQTLYGIQIGLFNKSENAYGLQIGLINVAKRAGGLMQIGLVNVINSNRNEVFPIINMGF